MANERVLRRALAAIEENPDDWDQGKWSSCLAGFITRLNGWEVHYDDSELSIEMFGESVATGRVYRLDDQEDLYRAEHVAKQLADLNWREAAYLFSPSVKDLDGLKDRVENVIAGEVPARY